MLDVKYVQENVDAVQKNCEKRFVKVDVQSAIDSYHAKNALLQEIEQLRAEQNQIASKMKGASADERPSLIETGRALKEKLPSLEEKCSQLELEFVEKFSKIPNLTHKEVPQGGEDEGSCLRKVGEPKSFSFTPKDHLELAQIHDLIDFESGAAVAGQKFYFLKNQAVFLELGLIRYALDIISKHGYQPTVTPDLAKPEILEGIGFSPRGEESQVYCIEGHDLCLIGTSEITIGGMYRAKILNQEKLPLRIAGISHCFRTEAGSHGQESKGLYRVHQFSKVEMFAFTDPEESEKVHAEMLAIEEEIFQGLELPYQVIDIASGDLGGPAYRKFDIEAWMPGRAGGSYGEVTSTSNCTDYQARRLKIRSKKDGKVQLLHTLNGTAIATTRAIVAILENGQQEDGSIKIPEKLVPYVGFDTIAVK